MIHCVIGSNGNNKINCDNGKQFIGNIGNLISSSGNNGLYAAQPPTILNEGLAKSDKQWLTGDIRLPF